MGRKKLEIKKIRDEKIRHITYLKRKIGLFKKAAQLALLCGANVSIMLSDELGNHTEFLSKEDKPKQPEKIELHPLYTLEHYPKFETPLLVDSQDMKQTKKSTDQELSQGTNKTKESTTLENQNNSSNYQIYQQPENMNYIYYPYHQYPAYFSGFQ